MNTNRNYEEARRQFVIDGGSGADFDSYSTQAHIDKEHRRTIVISILFLAFSVAVVCWGLSIAP